MPEVNCCMFQAKKDFTGLSRPKYDGPFPRLKGFYQSKWAWLLYSLHVPK